MRTVSIPGQDVPTSATIDRSPDECPLCHHAMSIKARYWAQVSDQWLEGIYQCASLQCHRLFISVYEQDRNTGYFYFCKSLPYNPTTRPLDPVLAEISPEFVETYQQSWSAKQFELLKIAGTGFRRSLEFLVKDYASRDQPENIKELIRKKPMVQCIRDHIQEEGIKTVAERAAWLGNDETHYLRKWEDKDINDLIDLIDSVGNWIVIHMKTERLKSTMPAP